MRSLEVVIRLLFFLVHVALVAIAANMLGNELSKPIDIFLVLIGGICISVLIVSMLCHLANLIKNIKKLTK